MSLSLIILVFSYIKARTFFFLPWELKIVTALEAKEFFFSSHVHFYTCPFKPVEHWHPEWGWFTWHQSPFLHNPKVCLPLSWALPFIWWFEVASYTFFLKPWIILLVDLHQKVFLVIKSADVKKKKIGISQSGTCSESMVEPISSVPSLCGSVAAGEIVFPTLKLPCQTKRIF